MTTSIVDGMFELRDLLKGGDIDAAQGKLRQLIMQAEKASDSGPGEADPLAGRIRDWLCMLLDDAHALELARVDRRKAGEEDFARHVVQRQLLLQQGIESLTLLSDVERMCELLGQESGANNLGDSVRQLQHFLRHHLILDEKLRVEVSSLGQFLADSIGRLEAMTSQMESDDSELGQARSILTQPLSENPAEAYEQLRRACDFLTSAEGRLDSAVHTVSEQMRSNMQEVEQLRSRLNASEKEARQDPLTGLANRRELNAYFAELGGEAATLLILDLDHFKAVNDTHGHDVGDEVLAEVGARLSGMIREGDMLARIGGEEFVVVLRGAGGAAAANIAEQIRQAVSVRSVPTAAGELNVTASAGVAVRGAGEALEGWMKRADLALYAAKHAGRDRTQLAG